MGTPCLDRRALLPLTSSVHAALPPCRLPARAEVPLDTVYAICCRWMIMLLACGSVSLALALATLLVKASWFLVLVCGRQTQPHACCLPAISIGESVKLSTPQALASPAANSNYVACATHPLPCSCVPQSRA